MKAHHFIAAALLAAPFSNAAQEVPFTDEAANALEAAMMQQNLSDFVRVATSLCQIMESVNDQASAEAALPLIRTRLSLLEELSFGVSYIPQEQVEQALTAAGITPESLEKAFTKLLENKFYGCAELAELFGYSQAALLEPGEVTPELLQTLGAELVARLGDKVAAISGGPGFTEQTAWIMGTDINNLDLVPVIMEALPGAEKEDQNLVYTEEGPIYGRMTFVLPYQGKAYRLQMWFDVTEIIKAEEAAQAQQEPVEEEPRPVVVEETEPVVVAEETVPAAAPQQMLPQPETLTIYSAEEKAAAVKHYMQQASKLADVLAGVTDKASADAAAPVVDAIIKDTLKVADILRQASQMDILEEMEKNGDPFQKLSPHLERILEADFYGSELLQSAIDQ